MAHSLEVRVPFLDHKLVEFCVRIPTHLKVHRLTTKYILKHAARGLVPDRIIDKKKIGFFHGSIGTWFSAQTEGLISDYLLAPDARSAEFLDRRELERLIQVHSVKPEAGASRFLLAALLLEIWLSDFLPRSVALSFGEAG